MDFESAASANHLLAISMPENRHPRMPLRILYVAIGALVSLLMIAGMALGFYLFLDWRMH
jgi:hypothetical protein